MSERERSYLLRMLKFQIDWVTKALERAARGEPIGKMPQLIIAEA
jgi:hypothetical protein